MPDTVLCHTCRKTLSIRDFPVLNDFNQQHHIANLDKEIEGLQGTLEELKTQQKALESCRDEARSLLAPVRKLPPEVLELVFDIVCTSFDENFALDITIKTVRALTLDLSQVCSVWREIVRATPSLWLCVSVDLSHRNGAFKVMKHYLNQSRDAPLTLYIFAGNLEPYDDADGQSVCSDVAYDSRPDNLKGYSWETLNILFLSSRRWRDVTVVFS
ncbi:hypothetical protein BDP27DRAFT_280547 [Rhodocollybia butyracea]|uniref:F-box domain-containing protein n=1 Tax=Rhodocollybia butyracea TaxID=206335 RepID=A0A9P5PVY5_9AGAR|nr:hypothetical protein BDP27DRAFT_280547 [Rhodocollybia butyracea]